MKQSPKNYVLWLLSRRDYSKKELFKKLTEKEISQEEIQSTLEYLESVGIQSDERTAKGIIRSYSSKKGDSWIANKLRQRGLSTEYLSDESEDREPEIDRASRFAEKFVGKDLSDAKVFNSSLRSMISKGFSMEPSLKILKQMVRDQKNQN